MNDSDDFLHVTDSPGTAEKVRAALKHLGRDEEVLGFDDRLCAGPIDEDKPWLAMRTSWWARVQGRALKPEEASRLDDEERWQRLRADARRVVLWHGPLATERLLALRACWELRERSTRPYEVRLEVRPTDDDPEAPIAPLSGNAVAFVDPAALCDAFGRCAPVHDPQRRASRWEQIRSRHGDWLRELDGDDFVHLAVDVYDTRLLDACGRAWTASAVVVERVRSVTPTGDDVLRWRCRELLGRGALQGRGGKNHMGLPEEVRGT